MNDMDWPWFITLGGEAGRSSANSDWVAWATSVLASAGMLMCILVAKAWYKWALGASTNLAFRMKVTQSFLFLIGGMCCFGMQMVMIWIPAWSLLLLTLLVSDILLVMSISQMRKVRAVIIKAELASRIHSEIQSIIKRSPILKPETLREELIRLCRDLERSNLADGDKK